jgi:hypothetical protein
MDSETARGLRQPAPIICALRHNIDIPFENKYMRYCALQQNRYV